MTPSQEARDLTDEQILDVPAGINNGSQAFLLRFARAVIDADRKATQQDALDARRYRWLRSTGVESYGRLGHYTQDALDAAIDAAIAKGERHE